MMLLTREHFVTVATDFDVYSARIYTKTRCISSTFTISSRQIAHAKRSCTNKHYSSLIIDLLLQFFIFLVSVSSTLVDSSSSMSHTLWFRAESSATFINWIASQRKLSQNFLQIISEVVYLNTLRQQSLKRERKRSDRDDRWKEDLTWTRQYLTQSSVEESAMRRLWNILSMWSDDKSWDIDNNVCLIIERDEWFKHRALSEDCACRRSSYLVFESLNLISISLNSERCALSFLNQIVIRFHLLISRKHAKLRFNRVQDTEERYESLKNLKKKYLWKWKRREDW